MRVLLDENIPLPALAALRVLGPPHSFDYVQVLIVDQVGVQPGETLLVSGAAGGVDSAVLQIAELVTVQSKGSAISR